MCNICLVHLVRKSNGLQPLTNFLESYKKYSTGIEHDLLIVFKGFESNAIPPAYSEILNSVAHRTLFVADRGFDIGAYFAAVKNADYKYFCFLNSYSVILDAGWLSKMHRHLIRPEIGLVGASASYEGPDPTIPISPSQSRFFVRRVASYVLRRWARFRLKLSFPAFPNPHIRTNAFMISREVMLATQIIPLHTKMDAQRFESGRRGLTRQVLDMKLRAVVVGRDGEAYEEAKWYESYTFRSGDQRNLLIADNRTEDYAQADVDSKKRLAHLAWGGNTNH